jgi:ABC-type transport system involved in multi-copper enzyme maturation permease subunit
MAGPVSDSDQFWTAFTYQLRFYLRTWRFLGLLLFVGGISALVLGVDLYHGSATVTATAPTASNFLDGYLGNVGEAVIIVGAFLGGDAIAMDMGGGPGYLMLTQPLRRHTLLLGRYAAAAATGSAIGLVYYAFAIAGSLAFYQTVPSVIAVSIGYALLFGLAVLALAFLFSAFFRSPAVSIVVSVLLMIIGFPVITAVSDVAGIEPWYSLDYAHGIITQPFETGFVHQKVMQIMTGAGGNRTGVRGRTSISLTTFAPYEWEGVAIMVGFLLIALVLAALIYRYKEVRG